MFEKMIQDMLQKMLPPEVMQLLSAEKVKEMGDAISTYISSTRESLARIEDQNAMIINLLSRQLQVPPYPMEMPQGVQNNG